LEVDPVALEVGLTGCAVTAVVFGLSDGLSASFGCWGDLPVFV